MQTVVDAPLDSLNEAERSFVARVQEEGWFDTAVFGDADGPGYSFTTGLWANAGHPELVIFSLSPEIAHDVFWDLFRGVREGGALPIGVSTNRAFSNLTAYAFPVAKRFYPAFLGWSRWFYQGDNFPCLQIVWPDKDGIFPWEPMFDQQLSGKQVDLTEHGWKSAVVL